VRCGQPWEGRGPEVGDDPDRWAPLVGCCERERREAGVGGPAGLTGPGREMGRRPAADVGWKKMKKKSGKGWAAGEREGREGLIFLFSFSFSFSNPFLNQFKTFIKSNISHNFFPTFIQLFLKAFQKPF
jgi:hypothetical protein